jgi:DNA repair protein SbcC/Rad50
MLPLTITIEGLLKYREKQTFDFTGQTLWLLYGPNGIGKSTVSDAITYALYGQHRGGKDHFAVTFDCMLENVHYRIHRLSRPPHAMLSSPVIYRRYKRLCACRGN